MTSEDILESSLYIEDLESKYGKLRRVLGVMGRWFSRSKRLFFDCEEQDRVGCLEHLFESRDIDALMVYYIVKGEDGYQLRDTRFRNIYGQTLERLVNHYHTVLEPSMQYGLKVGRLDYVECIGYGCSVEAKAKPTISELSNIKRIIEEETKLTYIPVEDESIPRVKVLQASEGDISRISVEKITIDKDSVVLYAPKDTSIEKPGEESGPEWERYLKAAAWKDAMALSLREKYYGILVTFDVKTASFKVELNYPVEEEKLRKACHALEESRYLK